MDTMHIYMNNTEQSHCANSFRFRCLLSPLGFAYDYFALNLYSSYGHTLRMLLLMVSQKQNVLSDMQIPMQKYANHIRNAEDLLYILISVWRQMCFSKKKKRKIKLTIFCRSFSAHKNSNTAMFHEIRNAWNSRIGTEEI